MLHFTNLKRWKKCLRFQSFLNKYAPFPSVWPVENGIFYTSCYIQSLKIVHPVLPGIEQILFNLELKKSVMYTNCKEIYIIILFACAVSQQNYVLAYLVVTRRRMQIAQDKKLLILFQKGTVLNKKRLSSRVKRSCWVKKRQNGCLVVQMLRWWSILVRLKGKL